MYHSARYEEPLLNQLQGGRSHTFTPVADLPESLRRTKPLNIPNLEESQVVRHFLHLSQQNYGIDTGIYPLGSCTMKYNPKICEEIAKWECFSHTHPCQNHDTVQGNLRIMYELSEMLCELTGMHEFALQPAAGAHGEFLGMLLTQAYHASRNDSNRTEVILPDTSHGTNPASAAMAGYSVVEIPSTNEGTIDLAALENALSNKTACFMLTNPNTLGIFESEISEIARIVHRSGALLYYDGANMNAIMGKTRPGDMGFDIVHLNLHKTFSTPHGGGGPGAGPIGVKEKLIPFLPLPRIKKKQGRYLFDYDYLHSIGKIKDFYGNFSVLLKAYVYILLMGKEGLTEASEIAVLNANYMKHKLIQSKHYTLPFRQLRKHEFVLSCDQLLQTKNIRAMDIAKRLLDYGLHPPTVYFPLIVKEALMIEPTESETKKTIDMYIDALLSIAQEDPELVKNAPQNTPVKRIDEAQAIKNPVLTWNMIRD
ncbi:MAG: aminomethyl-transferring glycine dehydrogenase subunit GcvPB [Candidatus Thermoplasmatota archaeon]|nr:aminomethyl-transferring glycine dehydrogenase subunit GcvPB [Candidatus Thermoplasmatota archaeon]MBU1941167.1 aminomethyl-transferring glycine dehydrogenase subunit GcvPB [Candidatus Thermoplasmatota archaeon]